MSLGVSGSSGDEKECRFCGDAFKIPRRGPRAYCSPYCVKQAERKKHREFKRKQRGSLPWNEYLRVNGKTSWAK